MKQQLYSYCLQGDVNKAFDYLLGMDKKNKSLEILIRKYRNRFFVEKPSFRYKTKDTWIRSVLKVYFEYFILVLTKKQSHEEAEKFLLKGLNNLIPEAKTDIDSVEDIVKKEFELKGYYFLGGVTAPYRGPYIWSEQKQVDYHVQLPLGEQKVTVYFLDGFLIRSWLDFATFGKVGTGGWATREALYCVKKSYEKDFGKPKFLYSYLAHEAQHLSDYEEFPWLDGVDLEYRAKLVELIYHPNNNSLIESFIMNSLPSKDHSPHLYANYVVCSNLSKKLFHKDFERDYLKWAKAGNEAISNHALQLFGEHTQLLREQSI